MEERIREGERLGFKGCIVPKAALQSLDREKRYRINIMGVSNLQQVFKGIDMYERKRKGEESRGE